MRISTTAGKKRIPQWCEKCLKERIYSNYGTMKDWYRWNELIVQMCIARDGNKIVGCGVVIKGTHLNFGVYVKKSYRRKGIGSQIIQKLKKNKLSVDYWANPKFFKENGCENNY